MLFIKCSFVEALWDSLINGSICSSRDENISTCYVTLRKQNYETLNITDTLMSTESQDTVEEERGRQYVCLFHLEVTLQYKKEMSVLILEGCLKTLEQLSIFFCFRDTEGIAEIQECEDGVIQPLFLYAKQNYIILHYSQKSVFVAGCIGAASHPYVCCLLQ